MNDDQTNDQVNPEVDESTTDQTDTQVVDSSDETTEEPVEEIDGQTTDEIQEHTNAYVGVDPIPDWQSPPINTPEEIVALQDVGMLPRSDETPDEELDGDVDDDDDGEFDDADADNADADNADANAEVESSHTVVAGEGVDPDKTDEKNEEDFTLL